MSRTIYGKRAVSEALRHTPDRVKSLLLDRGNRNALADLAREAENAGISAQWVDRRELERLAKTPKHQGVVAMADDFAYASVKDFLVKSTDKRRVVVAIDGVTDPHNLGACLRACGAFGVDLVVIPKDRSAAVNATVAKTAAGATEAVPVARETNLARALDLLKKDGFWIFGLDMKGEAPLSEQDLSGDVALVLGSEGSGLRRLTAESCDRLLRLPNPGPIDSLNVSQACAVALYEVFR